MVKESVKLTQCIDSIKLKIGELENKFLQEADENGLKALKGHRSVGGIRASIYNACGVESVLALVDFMDDFAQKNG